MLVTAVGAGVAAAVLATIVSRRRPLLPVWVVAAVTGAVAVVAGVRGTLLDTLTGPLGYANATAAFFVVGAAAAVALRHAANDPRVRAVALVAAVALASIPWLNRSRAGAVAALVVLAGLHPWVRRQGARRLAVATGVVVVVAVGTTTLVALRWSLNPEPGPVAATIEVDTTRTALWHKAVTLLAAEPIDGVGLGNFAIARPAASAEHERFAHNDFLQAGAEMGVVGAGLLLAGLGWVYWRLARGPDAATTTTAILALTAVALHMTVDYVGHFPAVLAVLGALVGAAMPEARAADGRILDSGPMAQPPVSPRSEARAADGRILDSGPMAQPPVSPRSGRSGPARHRPGPGDRPPHGLRRRPRRRPQ